MGTIFVDTLEPQSGTTLTVGETGQNTVVGGNTIKLNTLKDAGGNTIFISDGSGNLSSVNSGFGSAMVLLNTTTVSTAVATINFTSGFTSTYGHYVFKFYGMHGVTDAVKFSFQCSTDGGSNYNVTITSTAFRAYHAESGASALGYEGGADQGQGTSYQDLQSSVMANNADGGCSGELHLFNPASAIYVKQFQSRVDFMGDSNDPYSGDAGIAGYFNTATALNAISFKFGSGNIDGGKIKMFGIK